MRPQRSPLNRAWSRCPVIIVSSTYITSSARGVQQHTLSVKSTGRVEKEPVSGKNGHHHRDRDGRIALGRSTPDIAIKSVCHTQSVSQTPLFCRGDPRSYRRHFFAFACASCLLLDLGRALVQLRPALNSEISRQCRPRDGRTPRPKEQSDFDLGVRRPS